MAPLTERAAKSRTLYITLPSPHISAAGDARIPPEKHPQELTALVRQGESSYDHARSGFAIQGGND